jgi:GPH family glycoside/pentoside/hexuronide:cation symporter
MNRDIASSTHSAWDAASAVSDIPQTATATPDALKRWTLLAYSSLALPLALAEIPIIVYLPAFYAKELHLSASLVGLVFLSARLWDGASDLLIGWFSDRSRSRWGRRKPWVIVATPLLTGSLWYLCNPPQGAGLLYLGVWAILFYPAWTAMKIPYISWGAELATDYVERSRVTTFRETFTMLGNLLFAAAPLMFLAADAPLHQVLFLMAFTVLCTVPLATLILSAFVRDPVPVQHTHTRLLGGLTALANDRVLIRFVIATLLIWTSEGVINSLAVFSFGVGLQLPNKLFLVILILYIATLSAVPLTLRLARHWEKPTLLAVGMAVYTAATTVLIWSPSGNFPITAGVWIIAGIGYAAITVLPTSVLADIVDHGEVAMGERRSGAYTAIYYLVVKIGLALGVGVSFGLLQLVHFDPGAAHHDATDVRNIRLLGFGLPSLLYAGALLLYLKHPITKRVQQRLRNEIDSRGVTSRLSVKQGS